MNIMRVCIIVCVVAGLWYGYGRWYSRPQVSRESIQKIMDSCSADLEHYTRCMREHFTKIINKTNLGIIMQLVGEARPGNCHEAGHIIGDIAASKGTPEPFLINQCGKTCDYGCIHGVIGGFARLLPHWTNHVTDICVFPKGYAPTNADIAVCHHGIGHAVAEYLSRDVPRALVVCDVFGETSKKDACATGVLMESYSEPTGSNILPNIPKDIPTYCNSLPAFAHEACISQLLGMRYSNDRDIQMAFDVCNALPIELQASCVNAIGSQTYFVEQRMPQKITNACVSLPRYVSDCLAGSITSALLNTDGAHAQAICAASPPQYQTDCFRDMNAQYDSMHQTL